MPPLKVFFSSAFKPQKRSTLFRLVLAVGLPLPTRLASASLSSSKTVERSSFHSKFISWKSERKSFLLREVLPCSLISSRSAVAFCTGGLERPSLLHFRRNQAFPPVGCSVSLPPFDSHRRHSKFSAMSSQNKHDDKENQSSTGKMSVDEVYDQIRKDGKRIPKASTTAFLATALVGIPVWLTVILPLSVIYQTSQAFLRGQKVDDAAGSVSDSANRDEETFPSVSEIKAMEDRKYDIVLLGATGFTGKLAARYLAKTYGVGGDVKWALAGRSQSKLDKVKSDIAKELGNDEIMSVDTILVDTSIRSTLHKLVDDTRTVATTAGPFQMYGSSVVEYCAKYGTNYVDITGEVDWWKEMIMKWDDTAQQTGAKIISLCGHDSVPWDLTVHKLAQLLKEKCNDDLVQVDCLDLVRGAASGGTVTTMLLALEGKASTARFEFNPLLRKPDGSKSSFKTKAQNQAFIAPCRESRFSSSWTGPFIMSAINAQTVTRSHALKGDGNTAIIYREAALHDDFKTAFVNWFGLIIGITALLNPITREPIKKFALPKPGEGPSPEMMKKGFLCVSGFGVGSKGNKVESVMYFPNDPGYQDTARMLVESGLSLALDAKKLPVKSGGFFTSATGLGDVLLDRLCRTGTKFGSRVVVDDDGKIQSKL